MKNLEKIMIVEDDPDIRAVTVLVLEATGDYIIEACSSGKEAVSKVVSFMPDLILLDVMMPEMDGIDTIKALKKIPSVSSTPVVFLTARALPGEVAKFKKLGAADTILKPFDPETLSQSINNIWQRERKGNEAGK